MQDGKSNTTATGASAPVTVAQIGGALVNLRSTSRGALGVVGRLASQYLEENGLDLDLSEALPKALRESYPAGKRGVIAVAVGVGFIVTAVVKASLIRDVDVKDTATTVRKALRSYGERVLANSLDAKRGDGKHLVYESWRTAMNDFEAENVLRAAASAELKVKAKAKAKAKAAVILSADDICKRLEACSAPEALRFQEALKTGLAALKAGAGSAAKPESAPVSAPESAPEVEHAEAA